MIIGYPICNWYFITNVQIQIGDLVLTYRAASPFSLLGFYLSQWDKQVNTEKSQPLGLAFGLLKNYSILTASFSSTGEYLIRPICHLYDVYREALAVWCQHPQCTYKHVLGIILLPVGWVIRENEHMLHYDGCFCF